MRGVALLFPPPAQHQPANLVEQRSEQYFLQIKHVPSLAGVLNHS